MGRENWSDETLWLRILHNKSDGSRYANMKILSSRATKEIFDRSCALIVSENIQAKKIAIELLSQFGWNRDPFLKDDRPFSKEIVAFYFELLNVEKSSEIITSILFGISKNNNDLTESEVKKIASYNKHESENVRYGTVHALLGLNYNSAIKALIALSIDKSTRIRDWATFGLGTQCNRNTKAIKTALWQRVNDADYNTRYEAIVGLANRNQTEIKPIITEELAREDVMSMLFDAITALRATEYLPQLKKILKDANLDPSINQKWLNDLKECISALNILNS